LSLRCVVTQHQDWKNLRDTETDVGQQHFGARLGLLQANLPVPALGRDALDSKGVDQLHLLERVGDGLHCALSAGNKSTRGTDGTTNRE